MDIAEITAKARVLLEALPYIQDFRGSTFVVKYGGSFMDDPNPEVRNRVAYDIAFLAAVGIPTYGVPGIFYEADGGGVHGLNERIRVQSLYDGRDYLFDLVKTYANQE